MGDPIQNPWRPPEKIGLKIKNVTLDEAKELMQKVREIEQRHPKG